MLWFICIVRFATRQLLRSEPESNNIVKSLTSSERESTRAWTLSRIWLRPLQFVTILLYICVFKRSERRKYRRRTKAVNLILTRLSDGIERAMTQLGEWILKSLSDPNRAQRRRLQNAYKRHATRSIGTALAMSVLAMHARTAVATERMT